MGLVLREFGELERAADHLAIAARSEESFPQREQAQAAYRRLQDGSP